jgi:hypothetical protein
MPGGRALGLRRIELQRVAARRVTVGRVHHVVHGTVVREVADGGEVVHRRMRRQGLVQPNIQLRVAGGIPGLQLVRDRGRGRLHEEKRLGRHPAFEFNQAAARLQHLSAGERIEVGPGKGGEAEIGVGLRERRQQAEQQQRGHGKNGFHGSWDDGKPARRVQESPHADPM